MHLNNIKKLYMYIKNFIKNILMCELFGFEIYINL